MINNTDDYIALMKQRAIGALPDMGCALRVTELIGSMPRRVFADRNGPEILDVGCATGHFRRTFLNRKVPHSKYVGLEIDPEMVAAARDVWSHDIEIGNVELINQDLEQVDGDRQFDFVICVNAFMYFASAERALGNLLKLTRHHLLVRSYFTDANYRIIRAQTKNNHDKSAIEEIDVFDEAGDMRCFDFWNIYSRTYIEAVVAKLQPDAELRWIDDNNVLSSLEAEKRLSVKKRGATQVFDGQEVSYPFMLPWKWLAISRAR